MAYKTDNRSFTPLRAAALAIVSAFSLSACATVPTRSSAMHDGVLVIPPAGWMAYCDRNANDPSCKG